MKKHRKGIRGILSALLVTALLWQSGMGAAAEEAETLRLSQPGEVCAYDAVNEYGDRFFIPTQVYQAGGEFFVADAYHHQILHSSNVASEPYDWHPVGTGLYRPHAIATDGTIYLVVDTDNNRIVTYTRTETGYQLVESIPDVGVRPHYVVYDGATGQFYVWSSMTGVMYIYRRAEKGLTLTLRKAVRIPELDGSYTRSFTIDGGRILFPSAGRSAVYVVNKKSFKVQGIYPVASELSEMVQILHIQNYYYLVTSNDATREKMPQIVRASALTGFGDGSYEDIRDCFTELNGIPYYITQGEDGHFYTPVIEGSANAYICQFDIVNDQITNVVNYYY